MPASRAALIGLTLASLVSAGFAVVGLGLSAMAADDIHRAAEATRLQTLVFAWLAVSIAAPVVALLVYRRSATAAYACFAPVLVLGVAAILWLLTY